MPAPSLETLLKPHPRVRVLRDGPPDPEGTCIVYWMQRAQRGVDNAALNLAIALGNALRQTPDPEQIHQLQGALSLRLGDTSPLVREHVQWALKQNAKKQGSTLSSAAFKT